jgi:hypothetical protein
MPTMPKCARYPGGHSSLVMGISLKVGCEMV